jgi:hypothetical protein
MIVRLRRLFANFQRVALDRWTVEVVNIVSEGFIARPNKAIPKSAIESTRAFGLTRVPAEWK